MNEELPEFFDDLRPRTAPVRLRREVLAAVDRELSRRRKPRWERALELAVAACFLVGVGLTAWQWKSEGPWQRLGTPPASSGGDRYADRPAFGDDRLAEFVNKRLAARPPRRDPLTSFAEGYEKLLQEVTEPPAG
jgi:hypothetical protein